MSPSQPVVTAEHVAAADALARDAAQVLPEGGLAAKLALGRPLRVKFGIDPSGSSLTIGHAVVLRTLRRFQDAGHIAVLIIGDITGTVGDPTGRSAVRTVLSVEETTANASSYVAQVLSLLRQDRLEVRRNSEWLAPMTFPDVLREARELTVARLLERDDFAKRHAAGQPISLVEFLYPLLQGYDSVAVSADVELGGTDQTYNLLVGRDLQRAHGQPEQIVLTTPLLVGLDGVQKMSKSLGNIVALDDPPAEMFGKLMSLSDDARVGEYARLCTDLPLVDVTRIDAAARAGGPGAALAKREMARAVVAVYRGAEAAADAEQRFDTVFRAHALPTDLATVSLPAGQMVNIPALLHEIGWASSRSDGRRLVAGGGVRVDGVTLGDLEVPRDTLAGAVLTVGKRNHARMST